MSKFDFTPEESKCLEALREKLLSRELDFTTKQILQLAVIYPAVILHSTGKKDTFDQGCSSCVNNAANSVRNYILFHENPEPVVPVKAAKVIHIPPMQHTIKDMTPVDTPAVFLGQWTNPDQLHNSTRIGVVINHDATQEEIDAVFEAFDAMPPLSANNMTFELYETETTMLVNLSVMADEQKADFVKNEKGYLVCNILEPEETKEPSTEKRFEITDGEVTGITLTNDGPNPPAVVFGMDIAKTAASEPKATFTEAELQEMKFPALSKIAKDINPKVKIPKGKDQLVALILSIQTV